MSRHWQKFIVRLSITLALIYFLLNKFELGSVLIRIRNMDIALFCVATLLMGAQLLVSGIRWQFVATALGARLSRYNAIRLVLIGQFFSQALPSAIGGDVVRGWLASRDGISVGQAFTSVICDRILGLILLLVIACLTFPLLLVRVTETAPRAFLLSLYLGLVGALSLLMWVGPPLLNRWIQLRPVRGMWMVVTNLKKILFPLRSNVPVIALASVVQLGLILAVFTLSRGLSIQASLTDCVVLVPPIMLIAMLPLSVAGWGVREGAMVIGFGLISVPPTDALALSVVFGVIQLIVGVPGGAIWLAGHGSLPKVDLEAETLTETETSKT